MTQNLRGKIALVTGASRGIGKGIAKILCEEGATVYITGRKLGDSTVPLTLSNTAIEIAGGNNNCIPVECDHANDDDVKQLFDRISKEQDGTLDILVNNAFGGVNHIMAGQGKLFFEQPLDSWEKIIDVGTRSDYISCIFGAKMMVEKKSGLIVNISSPGGLFRIFTNIPYGVGKEAIDRMSMEMGMELKKFNVACVSLWPGAVQTESIKAAMTEADKRSGTFSQAEDATYAGKIIAALYKDNDMMKKTGKIHLTGELGSSYGIRDVDGNIPMCVLQPRYLMNTSAPNYAWLVPHWIYLPRWVVALKGVRF